MKCLRQQIIWNKERYTIIVAFQTILSNTVVFLAFIALKVKRKVSPKFWMPVDYNLVEKLWKFSMFCIWPFLWPSKNFFGLFNFFWDIWSESPVVCKNPISKHSFIPNSKWIKFPISVHCTHVCAQCACVRACVPPFFERAMCDCTFAHFLRQNGQKSLLSYFY